MALSYPMKTARGLEVALTDNRHLERSLPDLHEVRAGRPDCLISIFKNNIKDLLHIAKTSGSGVIRIGMFCLFSLSSNIFL